MKPKDVITSNQQENDDPTEEVKEKNNQVDLEECKVTEFELDMLAKMMGRQDIDAQEMAFWIELGNEDKLAGNHLSKTQNQVNLTKTIQNKDLEDVLSDLNFDDNEKSANSSSDDLLQLMDS